MKEREGHNKIGWEKVRQKIKKMKDSEKIYG